MTGAGVCISRGGRGSHWETLTLKQDFSTEVIVILLKKKHIPAILSIKKLAPTSAKAQQPLKLNQAGPGADETYNNVSGLVRGEDFEYFSCFTC